jgi:radical SAM protein with 4Fe4S-binding SPASM domain
MINLKTTDLDIHQCIVSLNDSYQILGTINLDNYIHSLANLQLEINELYKTAYGQEQRILIHSSLDQYNTSSYGTLLKTVQTIINKVDISNFFILFLTTNHNVESEYTHILKNFSSDNISFEIYKCFGKFKKIDTLITEVIPQNVMLDNLTKNTANIIDNNKNFCIMPWIQTQVRPNGLVYPCCVYNSNSAVGDVNDNSLSEIFNNESMRQIRTDMLNDIPIHGCEVCSINESSEKATFRQSANNKFLHHIPRTENTGDDGAFPYEHVAWDIRFNNLCNLKCRTCSPHSSTSWFADSKLINGNLEYQQLLRPSGVFSQYMEHLDHVEYIYFAGGEPLIIKECWDILESLYKQERFDIELVFNTNFTNLTFRGKSIFDYWGAFNHIHIGASLDAMGTRAEYWRSGTKWDTIVNNRYMMLQKLPEVGFSIDATVSLVNALHIPHFHKAWVKDGLIIPEQFNPKVLDYPSVFSLKNAPRKLKQKIYNKISTHIDWLIPLDKTEKSVTSFKSILTALTDETSIFDANGFWKKITQIDNIRNEKLIDVFPELECLVNYQ